MGRDFGEAGNALRLFVVSLGKARDLVLQGSHEPEQFLPAFFLERIAGLNAGLDLADGIFNHGAALLESGKHTRRAGMSKSGQVEL